MRKLFVFIFLMAAMSTMATKARVINSNEELRLNAASNSYLIGAASNGFRINGGLLEFTNDGSTWTEIGTGSGEASISNAVNGGILYASDGLLFSSASSTAGRAVVSGGTGSPTFFNPSSGDLVFGGASGQLSNNTDLNWNGSTLDVNGTITPNAVTSTGTIAGNALTSTTSVSAASVSATGTIAGNALTSTTSVTAASAAVSGTLTAASATIAQVVASETVYSHVTTTSNPSAGQTKTYMKSDNKFYKLTSAGVETEIGGTSSATYTFGGNSYLAADAICTPTVAPAGVLQAFGTDADCDAPTLVNSDLGTWQTTDANKFAQTINSLPAGIYKVTMEFGASINGTQTMEVAINDGTTTCPAIMVGGLSSGISLPFRISCYFTYASSGNRTFQPYVNAGASTITFSGQYNSTFAIERVKP